MALRDSGDRSWRRASTPPPARMSADCSRLQRNATSTVSRRARRLARVRWSRRLGGGAPGPREDGRVVTASATYRCRECGKVASTVTLVAPGEPDPRLTPEPPGVPPGASTILGTVFPRGGQLSIDGGPISITLAPVPMEQVAAALRAGTRLRFSRSTGSTPRSGAPCATPHIAAITTGSPRSTTRGSSTASVASARRATSGRSRIENGVRPDVAGEGSAAG